jgi:hypothetical protein
LNSSAISSILFPPFSWFISAFSISIIVYDYAKAGTVLLILVGVGTFFLLADV